MKKVVIMGASLNSGNRGVNALTRSTINLLLDTYGDIDIKVISSSVGIKKIINVKNNSAICKVEEIPYGIKLGIRLYLECKRKNVSNSVNELYQILKSADIVLDISEGDSFSDIYGKKRFLLHSIMKLVAIKMKKKLILMPQTMGPFTSKIVKVYARKITNKAKINFVRDKLSYKVLVDELGINQNKVIFSPDMAFYMKPSSEISIDNIIKNKTDNDIYVGFNISALLYNGGYNNANMFGFKSDYKELVDEVIKYFMGKDKNIKLVLVPHVIINDMPVEDDLNVCRLVREKFANKYGDRIVALEKPYREDEIKSIISGTHFFVGGRMHACIGAISSSVPTVPTAYSRKFIGIWKEFDLENCIADPRELKNDEIIDVIDKAFNNRKEIQNILNGHMSNIKSKIRSMINIIDK